MSWKTKETYESMVTKDTVWTQHRLTCRVGSCRVRALSVHRCDLGSTQALKLCRFRLLVLYSEARFSKVPKTFRVRKAIRKTPTCLF